MQPRPATISITEPKAFNAAAVAVIHGYGILLAVPIVAAILVISLTRFGFVTVLLPLLAVAAMAYFLPFGFGNPHVTRLVKSFAPPGNPGGDRFVIQLTLVPRLRTGLRAVLEDADDIGYLSFAETELVFQGDSVKLALPFERIARVEARNVGWRVPFIHGWRMRLAVTGLPGIESIEIAERSSCVLSTSRSVTRQLNACIVSALKNGGHHTVSSPAAS